MFYCVVEGCRVLLSISDCVAGHLGACRLPRDGLLSSQSSLSWDAQMGKSSNRSFLYGKGLHMPQALVQQHDEQSCSRAFQAGMDVFVA